MRAVMGGAPPVKPKEPRHNNEADGDRLRRLEAYTKTSTRRDVGGSAGGVHSQNVALVAPYQNSKISPQRRRGHGERQIFERTALLD